MPSKSFTRTWGTRFDSLPSSSPPPASPKSTAATDNSSPQQSIDTRVNKARMPHDASIFVGSLPVNVDHDTLRQSLLAYLAEVAPVVSIKVIRDNKGGTCAFVQCEDAGSATNLLQNLHSSTPKLFMGRQLRFEQAMAYRSLLISYRTPTEPIMTIDGSPSPTETVELTLPFAMRIHKHRNAKSSDIFYNEQAIEHSFPSQYTFFREPVICDTATLKEICGFFGPLEHFKQYKTEAIDGDDNKNPTLYPSPHDAPRKPNMAVSCFDVKFSFREDCINALMTLRRVPHLTVTWAHPSPEREMSRQMAHRIHHPYSLFPRIRPNSISTTSDHSRTPSVNDFAPNGDAKDWNPVPQPPSSMSQTSTCVDPKSKIWLETDFPPLVDPKDLKFESGGVWVEKKPSAEAEKDGESFVDGSSEPHVFGTASSQDGLLDNVHPLASGLGPRASITPLDVGQELEFSHTPSLARSPVTPKTPGSVFPPTPTSFHGGQPGGLFSKEMDDYSYVGEEILVDESALDPTTLFVGGLEMHGPGSWDEEKVYDYFSQRFGGVESVKMIRPSSGKPAFAFVKFNNTEGPARAVYELHNRVVEGRAMRVQLRDCNPTRGAFRGGRGRGRYSNFSHGHRRRQSAQNESKKDKSVDASCGEPLTIEEATVETVDAAAGPDSSPVEPSPEYAEPTPVEVIPAPNVSEIEPSSETYREWYEFAGNINQPPQPPTTPPPGGSLVPEIGPDMPLYPAPAFYTPGPWMHQYPPPHMPYPVAYYPFPAVPPNGPPPRYPGSSGSDGSGPNSVPVVPWNGINYGYIPYSGYHPRPTERPQEQQAPPVVPTGFFQNEAGTLIPVYPRATIDQYMTNNPNQRNSPPIGIPVTVPAPAPSPVSILSGGPVQAPWPQCIPPPFGSNQFPHRIQGPPPNQLPAQSSGWMNTGPPMSFQLPHSLPSPNMPALGAPPFREGFQNGGLGNGNKRHRHLSHGRGRGGNHRGRGNASMGNPPHADGHLIRHGQFNSGQIIGDWTHWPEAHQEVGKSFIS